jgi:hypothetical protein
MHAGRWIEPEPIGALDRLAFDDEQASSRRIDLFGRMHVDDVPISKAAVNPYRGGEIPNWRALGLEDTKIYYLLRDPDELNKAASTFNNLQVLSQHIPVTAAKHQPQHVIGTTGSEAAFDGTHLRNSIAFWEQDHIDGIEDDRKKELSSSYAYRADMTPGSFHGVPYDGVMRDIVGNHVALVKEGRAGHDVVVGDSKEGMDMPTALLSRKAAVAQGALFAYLNPKLAADAQIDLTPVFIGVNAKNFAEKKAAIIADLQRLTTGKLAKDAKIDDVTGLLDKLEKEQAPAEDNSIPEIDKDNKTAAGNDDAETEEEKAARMEKRANDKKAKDAKMAKDKKAKDDFPDDLKDKDDKKKADDAALQAAKDAAEKDMVSKPAMDEAIKTAVAQATASALKVASDIREAERDVRPYVGELTIAMDSAASVYRGALKVLGDKEVDTVFKDATAPMLAAVLHRYPKAGEKAPRTPKLAMDAASVKGTAERYPELSKIRTM